MSDEPIFMEDSDDDFIRPFLVTAGRTRTNLAYLNMETMVKTTGVDPARLRFEASQVIGLCRGPLSVAEISAHLKIPLGIAKVLVGDLIEDGYLSPFKTVSASAAADINLIQRLAAGVRAL